MEQHIRLDDTSLKIVFSEGNRENEAYNREFISLHMLFDDPLNAWLQSDKIRKESENTDKILLTLIKELHRKIDILTQRLSSDESLHLPLSCSGTLKAMGYEHVMFDDACLQEGVCYYGRIDMPTFPRRHMGIFFEALSSTLAKITVMHEDDKKDWNAYMAACERAMIRRMKGREE